MPANQRLASKRLLWAAGILLGLLLFFALAQPPREARGLRHLVAWVGTAAFAAAWWLLRRRLGAAADAGMLRAGVVVGAFAACAAAAVLVGPFHSSDVEAYVNVGRLQTAYGANPYVSVPADLPTAGDPLVSPTWRTTPCTYGFGFALVARGVVALAGESMARARLLFQLLGALSLLACAWLVRDTAGRLGRDETTTVAWLLLWSPWALLHFVANAHNDVWMGLALVLAARALIDRRWWLVVPALVLGAALKHLALVALPFFLLVIVRRAGWRPALASLGLGALVGAAIAWPYVGDAASFRWAEIASILTAPWNSLSAALVYTWTHTLGRPGDAAATALRLAFGAAFLLFALWRVGSRVPRRDYDARTAIADAATTLFVLLVLASAAWHPWYPGMLLPLCLLLPAEHRVRRLAVAVTVAQLVAFTPLAKARVLEALVMLAAPLAWVLAGSPRPRWMREDPPRRAA